MLVIHILTVCFLLQPMASKSRVIPKSRYDSIDSYLSPCSAMYNDLELVKDDNIFQDLIDHGW